MIYFITSHEDTFKYFSENYFPDIQVLYDDDSTFKMYCDYVRNMYEKGNNIIGFDKETNGTDPYVNDSLLDVLGDEEVQFVLHSPYCNTKKYFWFIRKKFVFLGHNIKFDIKFAYSELNIWIRNVYDTMIAEQRLYMKSGLRFALAELMIRYLEVFPKESDKRIRDEFIGCNVDTFKLQPRHIYYVVGDIKYLFEIRRRQIKLIEKYKMEFLLFSIEFPLISIIAKAENTGWDFDKDKWLALYEENIKKRFELEKKMDDEVRRLRDLKLTGKDRMYMVGGKWDNERKHNPIYDMFNPDGTTTNLNLFGETMSTNTLIGSKAKVPKKIHRNPNNINYGSETQIIEIFGRLKEPLLNKKENLVVPFFNSKGKIDRTNHSYQTGEDAFTIYKNMSPKSPMIPFIEMLIEHRGLCNSINNFGANFIGKINPVTGKLHTIFRQARAVTGRMQSGGGRAEPDKYNAQNIPKNLTMRNCFIAPEGHSIITSDYTGAELIVMCSLSQDMKLLEISKKDIHSYVAQACWRNIYKYKANHLIGTHESLRAKHGQHYKDQKMIDKINEYIKLVNTYIVDKSTEGGAIRQAFKPMTFGTIYGMWADKAAKTLKIRKEEGQIVINTIKSLFPRVFAMVEKAARFASTHGYIVFNKRTNSRAWFPETIKAMKGVIDRRENFFILKKEENEARNITIQGTQADAVKEATVELQKWIDINDLADEIIILKWVHDEIVDRCPKYLDGKSDEWKKWIAENTYGLRYIDDNNKTHIGLSYPAVKRLIMIDTFNRYLTNVTIDVDSHIKPYWTK